MNRENHAKYIFLELIAVAFLATGGIFIRICSIDPVNCGFYRVLFSMPFLYPFAKKQFYLLQKKDVILLLISGIFFATDIALANMGFLYTSVANVNLLSTLTPLTIVPVSFLMFKEKFPGFYGIVAFIALVGGVLLIGGKIRPTLSNYFGDILALLSSVFYAIFFLIVYKMRERIQGSTILFVTGISSLITLFGYSYFLEGFQIPTNGKDFLCVFGISVCMQIIGQNLMTWCQGNVSVNISSIVGLMQPAFAAIYSWMIFREALTGMEILGIFIVALGVYLVKLQYKGK